MEDQEIQDTKKVFEIFIDHTEIKELINTFFSDAHNSLNQKFTFPDLESIINKKLTHEILHEKIKENE